VTKANETNAPVVAPVTTAGQFYSATTKSSTARDVSSLVKQIGEAWCRSRRRADSVPVFHQR